MMALLTECSQHRTIAQFDDEPVPTVSARALWERINSGVATFVLDVRTPEEYNGPLGHIEGSRLIPLQELGTRMHELSDVRNQQVFVVCKGGVRSAQATHLLLNAGYQVSNVTGGMRAWNDLVRK